MSAGAKPTPKAFPNVKTIVLREEDERAKKTDTVAGEESRPGVWQYDLREQITLREGDEVMIKSSYIDTSQQAENLIEITQDEIDQLSITTGLYWQDSGNGVDIQRYAQGPNLSDPLTFPAGFNFQLGGPLPVLSQALQSEGEATIPNSRNYICQNTTDDFANTILYLNTNTVVQTAQAGGAVATLGAITVGGTGYTSGQGLATTSSGAGKDLLVDITAAGGVVTVVTVNSGISRGEGYAVGDTCIIQQPGSSGTAQFSISTLSASTPIAVEMVPNPNYDPTSANHEYYDYTLKNAADNTTTWIQPTPDGSGNIPLNTVANLVDLKMASDPADANQFFLYSNRFSQGHTWTDPVPENTHIATIRASTDPTTKEPMWSFIQNLDWNQDQPLGPPPSSDRDGWYFSLASPGTIPDVTFNLGNRGGVFRICLGVWLWVWDPGPKSATETFPSTENGHVNNYNLTLHYYQPGSASGAGGSYNTSRPASIAKEWTIDPKRKDSRLNDFYDPQFPKFIDSNRSGYGQQIPDSQGFPAPLSQFPQPPPAPPDPVRPGGGGDNRKAAQYPQTRSGGTTQPCWFGNMPDTSSTSIANRNFSTWEPFVYDSQPGVTHGAADPDAANFQPFRITTGNPWKNGRSIMKDYPFAGIVPQDARGPVKPNTKEGEPSYPPVVGEIPPIWTTGHLAKDTTVKPPPPYKLTHECVLSKPYIPGNQRHMTARVFTTKLKDIPGVETTLKAGTYTYAAWARLLTDTLNRVPARRTPQGQPMSTGGLSNNPDNPLQSLNKPTFSQSRLLTDTVQLGYQGLTFPSNRVGLDWNPGVAPDPKPVALEDAEGQFLGYADSEQPYWLSERANALFKWKDGEVQAAAGGNPVDYATVDPMPTAVREAPPHPTVYGTNGPKWAGAESFSIIFNEESQAFEIAQMHSNMYDAQSGAIVLRQFQSGVKGQQYPQNLGEFNIADQSGGVFITDWQPKELWEGKMNMSPNMLVHTGGSFQTQQNFQVNSFVDATKYPNLTQVVGNPVDLIRGTNITGNYRSTTGMIDKRVNIQSATPKPGDFIGGNYDTPEFNFDLSVETQTPVTILGRTIVPSSIQDPFFMIELKGINRNELYGLHRENSLISQLVGRYYTTGSYTEGSSDGSITYVHRGEPMIISELGIRILDSAGNELSPAIINPGSAVVIEIASQDVSLESGPTAP